MKNNELFNSNGEQMLHCSCCKSEWNDGLHLPCHDALGTDESGSPVWTYVCASCAHFDMENNPAVERAALAETLLKKAEAGHKDAEALKKLAARLIRETEEIETEGRVYDTTHKQLLADHGDALKKARTELERQAADAVYHAADRQATDAYYEGVARRLSNLS